jgi:hypothetical protein
MRFPDSLENFRISSSGNIDFFSRFGPGQFEVRPRGDHYRTERGSA